jgi:hypothetical protein
VIGYLKDEVGGLECGIRELRMSSRVSHPTRPHQTSVVSVESPERRFAKRGGKQRWRGLYEWWISFLLEKERVGCCSWEDGADSRSG